MEHQKIRQIELFGVERCQFEAGMEYILSLSLSLSLFSVLPKLKNSTQLRKNSTQLRKKEYAAKKNHCKQLAFLK